MLRQNYGYYKMITWKFFLDVVHFTEISHILNGVL